MHALTVCVEHIVRWCGCHGKLEIELHDGATMVVVGVEDACLACLPGLLACLRKKKENGWQ